MEKESGIIFTEARSFLGKIVPVKMDRPLGSKHPKHGYVYPVNYGFVPETKSPDGEELDAYILGVNTPLEEFSGQCIAVVHRLNDNDDKLVVVPEGMQISDEEIQQAIHFQEQYFQSEIIRNQ
ncbi:MAG: inorganic diphosphatase [Candidatus Uhrbacteria bacterium]